MTTGATSVCGSSLLSNTRAVTAAHCWRDSRNQARQFTVVLGSARLFSGGTRIITRNVVVHSGYNVHNLNNDVAMISINFVSYTSQCYIYTTTILYTISSVCAYWLVSLQM